MWHWLSHWLGLNGSSVHTWWDGDDFYVALKCDECGKTERLYKTYLKKGSGPAPRWKE